MLPPVRHLHRFGLAVALIAAVALAATPTQLYALLASIWPEHTNLGPYMAGQIEAESQWKIYAHGRGSFGLIQVLPSTWRYWINKDRSLHGWSWADRFNPQKQMIMLILIDRYNWGVTSHLVGPDFINHTAFMLSSYNEGLGTLLRDVHQCSRRSGCNSHVWFGNVENSSGLRRQRGINRRYVRHIIFDLAPRYQYRLS